MLRKKYWNRSLMGNFIFRFIKILVSFTINVLLHEKNKKFWDVKVLFLFILVEFLDWWKKRTSNEYYLNELIYLP